jgi:hypothetical protein
MRLSSSSEMCRESPEIEHNSPPKLRVCQITHSSTAALSSPHTRHDLAVPLRLYFEHFSKAAILVVIQQAAKRETHRITSRLFAHLDLFLLWSYCPSSGLSSSESDDAIAKLSRSSTVTGYASVFTSSLISRSKLSLLQWHRLTCKKRTAC